MSSSALGMRAAAVHGKTSANEHRLLSNLLHAMACQLALHPEAVRWIHWRSRSASVGGRAAVSRSTMYRGKGKLSR